MRHALIALAIVVLAACGGGGGGGDDVPGATVQVGGTLAGLGAGKSVVVADAGGQSASLSANGRYSLNIPVGTAFNLRIQAQPAGQTCVVANGTGTATADIDNIAVTCTDNNAAPGARTVGGTVTGLAAGKSLVLLLTANGAVQEATVNADGSFQFAEPVAGAYTITVKSQPVGQGCTVANSQGSAGDVPAVTVSCAGAGSSFKLGGTIGGNVGVVAIRNRGNGDTLTLNSNGAFVFAQPVLAGGSYEVDVFDHSAGQTCVVAGGSGTASADVASIQVQCTATPVVLVPGPPSVPSLTMSYSMKGYSVAWGTATAPYGLGGTITYRLFEDADGSGPLAGTQVGGTLTTTFSHTQVITSLLHTRASVSYTVQACNSIGCSSPTAAITPNLAQAVGYFKASNNSGGGRFGSSVAISSDGNTMAVGAPFESNSATGVNGNQANGTATESGSVYVFVRSGGVWSQQAYIKASNTQANDGFGISVALSADGSTLAVGAMWEDSAATGINGNQADNSATDSGAAYVFTRSAGTWSQQAYVKASNTGASDQFGFSVALSANGDTLAAGARFEQSIATGINGNEADNSADRAGAAYVFTRTAGAWSQQAYIKADNTQDRDWFGYNVALSADGDTLAAGAYNEDNGIGGINGNGADNRVLDSGAVYVFIRSAGTWTQQAYIKSDAPQVNEAFGGTSLSLSADGNTLAVSGVIWNNVGAAYVFTRSAGVWSQQQRLSASGLPNFARFGAGVSLTADGNTLAVGAPSENRAAIAFSSSPAGFVAGSGAVYLFTRTAGTWSQQAYLKAPNTRTNAQFGYSVSFVGDGSTLAVGSYLENSNATGIGGNQAGSVITNSGAVYLY